MYFFGFGVHLVFSLKSLMFWGSTPWTAADGVCAVPAGELAGEGKPDPIECAPGKRGGSQDTAQPLPFPAFFTPDIQQQQTGLRLGQ